VVVVTRLLEQREVVAFVKAALECSVYVAPLDPGLTDEELLEVGRRAGLQDGEIRDAIGEAAAQRYMGDKRLMPESTGMWGQFNFPEQPDYRNMAAFDLVASELQAVARSQGAGAARIDRAVVVERAVAKQIPKVQVEAAITIWLIDRHLQEENGVLRFAPGRDRYPLPSEQQKSARPDLLRENVHRKRAFPLVKDVIERRTDGRPASAEPLDAFADALDPLGYGPFRLWWRQTVAELRHLDPSISPVAVTVLAAALVEGALTFVVRHAKQLGLGVLGSKDFDRPATSWKIEDLVSSAAAGKESAILDNSTRLRADDLVRTRQRIHAGRMLAEFPQGVPDLRPEEARAAKATAEQVVRRVLDWLARYPATQGPASGT
jgi:hypothetical protein